MAKLRKILHELGLYIDRTDELYQGDIQLFGFNITDDKAIFFDQWNVNYLDWEDNYAQGMVNGESRRILEELFKGCHEVLENDPVKFISSLGNLEDYIVFEINLSSYEVFRDELQFLNKDNPSGKDMSVSGYDGILEVNGKYLPVYEIYNSDFEDSLLIVNMKKFGQLIQYSPLENIKEKEYLVDAFLMFIKAYSEDEALLGEILSQPPEWLLQKGNFDSQKAYLQERVIIKILQRIEFQIDDNFEGFKVLLPQ